MDIATVFDQLFEGGDADFEEFVEVGADDGEEFESFEKGLGWILGLFEDALIKGKPAELTIEVRGGVEGHQGIISERRRKDEVGRRSHIPKNVGASSRNFDLRPQF